MNQPMREHLKQIHEKPQAEKPQKRRSEVLTDREIKSLMGMDRPTYKRYKGSYRQR